MNKTENPTLDDKAHWTEVALNVYRKLDRNRAYALTDSARVALGALAKAFRENGGSFADSSPSGPFAHFLKNELAVVVDGLFQQQAADPPPLPKPWVDPITNQPLENPWLSREPWANKAKQVLEKRDLPLAKHFQAMSRDPYGTIVALQDAAAVAKQRKLISYDAETHKANPFLAGNLTESSRFAVVDPERAEFYRREAKPLNLPWQIGKRNLTKMGQIAKHPEVHAAAKKAEEILRAWMAEELKARKAARDRNEREAKELETALTQTYAGR
jgi:hypothetical protein